jgi:hypothetical protein
VQNANTSAHSTFNAILKAVAVIASAIALITLVISADCTIQFYYLRIAVLGKGAGIQGISKRVLGADRL